MCTVINKTLLNNVNKELRHIMQLTGKCSVNNEFTVYRISFGILLDLQLLASY